MTSPYSSGEKMANLTVVDHQQTGQRFFIGTLVPASNDNSSSGSQEANYKQDFSIFDKMLQPTIAITKEGLIDYINEPLLQLTGAGGFFPHSSVFHSSHFDFFQVSA